MEKPIPQPDVPASRLAAILFADIAGYTALMQKDAPNASLLLRHFQQQLEEKVNAHKGRIVNFYGDGALCIFSIPLDAVRCAMALQSTFGGVPVTPVRIGIHSGTVTVEGDRIFGDSVNIASRIESMGVPGAVLFSKKIRDEIKNQPELSIAPLGRFAFKNVEEELEVFALANPGFIVPEKATLSGKLKTGQPNYRLLYFLAGLFLLAVAGIYFFQKNNNLLPDSIREARLAVLPFENKTNDPELDILGDMAADWVTEGLAGIADMKVVSFQNTRANSKLAETGDNSAFIKATGAEKIIRGNFYLEGEQIIFRSQIADAESGVLEKAMPQVRGRRDRLTELVRDVQQRILSYFVSRGDATLSLLHRDNPPKFEAYKLWLESKKYFGRNFSKVAELSEQAIVLDSTYGLAYYTLFVNYHNAGRYEQRDSVYQLVRNKDIPLSPIEALYFELIMKGSDEALARELLAVDPKNVLLNYDAALVFLERNKPEEVVRICQHIDPSVVDISDYHISWWFKIYADALTRLGRLGEAVAILDHLPAQYDKYTLRQVVFALRNQTDSIEQRLLHVERQNPGEDISWAYVELAEIYGVMEDRTRQKEWAGRTLNYIRQQPESVAPNPGILSRAYYLNEQYDDAFAAYRQRSQAADFGSRYNDQGLWDPFSRLGSIYAKTGEREKALDIIEKLRSIPDPYPFGQYDYAIARIYAQLNEAEKAMIHLRQAFADGFGFHSGYRYHFDVDLQPLYGYAPFEKFVKYRWKKQ